MVLRKNNVKVSDKTIINEKSWIDYLYYSVFLLVKPRTSEQYAFKTVWKNSKAGSLLVIVGIWMGFVIGVYYNRTLLSFLTVPSYEKALKTIPGM